MDVSLSSRFFLIPIFLLGFIFVTQVKFSSGSRGLFSNPNPISRNESNNEDQQHKNTTLKDGYVTVHISNDTIEVKVDFPTLTEMNSNLLDDMHKHQRIIRSVLVNRHKRGIQAQDRADNHGGPNPPKGYRRGYGGTYKKKWGFSSHEWGLGKG